MSRIELEQEIVRETGDPSLLLSLEKVLRNTELLETLKR